MAQNQQRTIVIARNNSTRLKTRCSYKALAHLVQPQSLIPCRTHHVPEPQMRNFWNSFPCSSWVNQSILISGVHRIPSPPMPQKQGRHMEGWLQERPVCRTSHYLGVFVPVLLRALDCSGTHCARFFITMPNFIKFPCLNLYEFVENNQSFKLKWKSMQGQNKLWLGKTNVYLFKFCLSRIRFNPLYLTKATK